MSEQQQLKKITKDKVNSNPYWPHVIMGLFGLYVIWLGYGAVSGSIFTITHGGDDTSWKYALVYVAFGSALIGSAMTKAANIWQRKRKAGK